MEGLKRYLVVPKYDGDSDTYIDENGEEKPKGWKAIGVVANPAIEIKGLAFSAENVEQNLMFANENKMRIAAPLAVPMVIKRKPIQAEEGEQSFNEGQPFEVEWTEENIERFMVSFMKNPQNLKDLFNYEHDGSKIMPAYILEIWIVDKPKQDRSFSTFGIEVPKGSVFVVVQFTDKNVFQKIVDEDALGLSVEGVMGLELKMSAETVQEYADLLILNNNGEVQMLHRKETDEFEPNKWGFPGGKIEQGETPKEAVIREAFEETGWQFDDVVELETIQNEDGSVSHYFTAKRQDEVPCFPSDEHDGSEYMGAEQLASEKVIMEQNERFSRLLEKAKNQKEAPMKEGDIFKIGDIEYIVKDGKPVPMTEEKEVEQMDETKEEVVEEKEVEQAEEMPTESAKPAEGLTEEKVIELITKTVKPMIEESMKAVVEATVETEAGEDEEEMQFAKEEVKTEKANPLAGFASWSKKEK